jgi:hypothetical protein
VDETMTKVIHKFDVFDQVLLTQCINDYYSRISYQTSVMNKCSPGNSQGPLTDICQQVLGTKLKFCSGNFYKHTTPYLPHTDYKLNQENELNVVIPLEFKGTTPHLIVFDQIWNKDSVTWCMHKKLLYFEVNTGVKGCPADYPDIQGLTDLPIDDSLYKYITHYPKNTLFGLSGNAFSFTPGSIIAFNNKQIHCTSTFIGEKLGISLRFKVL